MKIQIKVRAICVASVLYFMSVSSPGVAGAPTVVYRHVHSTDLPQLLESGPSGNLAAFKKAILTQVEDCVKNPSQRQYQLDDRKISMRDWCVVTGRRVLAIAGQVHTLKDLFKRLRVELDWYRSSGTNQSDQVTFTGYYSPSLEASRKPQGPFVYPIYKKPTDLVLVNLNGKKVWRRKNRDGSYSLYDDRKAIDLDGSLQGKGLEIAYARDLLSVFILQVQGSGILNIHEPDGSTSRVMINYAAQNGHPYVALRRVLQEQGVADEYLTIPGMRKWFDENQKLLIPTLIKNPSYVFFAEGKDGPYGATSLILTPWHSVAIDPQFTPLAGLLMTSAQRPHFVGGELKGWKPFTSLVLAQDTGGAIVGPGRVDFYFGEDSYSELAGGHMNQTGELYLGVVRD